MRLKRDTGRACAALELSLLFALWFVNVWVVWARTGASVWTAAGFAALAVVVGASIAVRRPSWKSAGFRLDNFGPALRQVAAPVALFGGLFLAAVYLTGARLQFTAPARLAQVLAGGIAQQGFFLGYLLQRWSALLGNPAGAVFANAVSFAAVHLPHAYLSALTFLGGLFLGALFLRARNVLALGVVHGVLSALLVPTLRGAGMLDTTQIGPPELAPLAEAIVAERRPGERVGVGPRGVEPSQLGPRFQTPVEVIGDRYRDDAFNREKISAFLTSPRRVFLLLSEADYQNCVPLELRQDTYILAQRWVLRRKFTFDRALVREFFHGDGDFPVLAALRERALLLSNRPPPAPR
ncbi:MAG TPA: type II CAAX endopeptidase family protein [Candidatus Acidoferrales bacterium]|nr:type II CAAX endopeptidase family protein [Candidatus Acidoferrales bacterium]